MKRGESAQYQPRGKGGRLLPTHGMRNTPTGNSWYAMMSRCFNPNYNGYKPYGGSGITVCEFLRKSPISFVSILGERPLGTTIDRINGKLNYSCGKCEQCAAHEWRLNIRWANRDQQNSNKVTNVIIEIGGKSKTVTQWARQAGIPRSLIFKRLGRGWSGAKLLEPPHSCDRIITIGEITGTLRKLAKSLDIGPRALAYRIKTGWEPSKILGPRRRAKRQC